MNQKTNKKSLKTRYIELRRSLLSIIQKMSISEKVVFGVFVCVFALSGLFLLKKASDSFSVEVPVRGGSFHEGVVGFPRYINPVLPVTDAGRDLSMLIFSGLMKVGANGNVEKDLASEYSISPDGLTYTVTLKDDVYFHDGTPITAYDVEFTIKKVTDPIIKSPRSANWDGVTTTVVDNKTLSFALKRPYAPFLENLTLGILPQHIWKGVDSDGFLFSQFNFEPIGSGPYKIKYISRNSSGLPDYYELEAFDKYVGGQPYIDSIFVHFYSSETKLLTAYEAGDIESMSSISPASAEVAKKDGAHILQAALPRDYAIFFNQNESKILADKNVRLALKLATPEDKIIKDILAGYATPIESPLPLDMSGVAPRSIRDEDGLEAARLLLSKTGWKQNQNGILEKGDKKATTTLSFSLTVPNVDELKATANILKDAWGTLGIQVTIKIFDSSDLQQNIIVPRKYEALLFGESIGRNVDLYPFWHSSERKHPGLNITEYANSKADKYLVDARTTIDLAKRKSLYQSFEKEIVNDIPAIFLYSPDLIYVLPSKIKGVGLSGITSSAERFANVRDWYIETEQVWNLPFFINDNN